MKSLVLLFIVAGFSGCAGRSGSNPAAPDVARLRNNHAREVETTAHFGRDVVDAKDLVRQIEHKNALLDR